MCEEKINFVFCVQVCFTASGFSMFAVVIDLIDVEIFFFYLRWFFKENLILMYFKLKTVVVHFADLALQFISGRRHLKYAGMVKRNRL